MIKTVRTRRRRGRDVAVEKLSVAGVSQVPLSKAPVRLITGFLLARRSPWMFSKPMRDESPRRNPEVLRPRLVGAEVVRVGAQRPRRVVVRGGESGSQ